MTSHRRPHVRSLSSALLLASVSLIALAAVTPTLAQAPPLTKEQLEAARKKQGQPPAAQQRPAQPPAPPARQAAPTPPQRPAPVVQQPRATPPPPRQAIQQPAQPKPSAPPVQQQRQAAPSKPVVPAAKPPQASATPPPAKTAAPAPTPPAPPKATTAPNTPPPVVKESGPRGAAARAAPPATAAPVAKPPVPPVTTAVPAAKPPTPPVTAPAVPAPAAAAPNTPPTARAIGPIGGTMSPARAIGTPPPAKITVAPVVGPARFADVKQARVERTGPDGRRIIEEPGNRIIVRQNNRVIIQRNERTQISTFYPNARSIPRPGGITETIYVRPDGVRVFSEVDGSGRLVRRYGRGPGGRDIVYVDNRRFYRNAAIGVGAVAVGVGIALALSPPVVAMPRERYIMDYNRASDDDIYETLTAPPVMKLERAYSLDEVRYSQPLRERMRRVDLDTITFEFGSFEITEDQYNKLERIARAIARAIEKNPGEMYLIEGHTDAVGSTEDNLSLSDRRAEAVARVLTEYYAIPMENLVTQGYGEQYPKVESSDAERANRRVALRRITPLLSQGQGG